MGYTLIIGGNLKGDVTSCRIENVPVRVDKKHVYSLTQNQEYVSYDVCSKNVVQEYVVPELTGFGVFFFYFAAIVGFILIVIAIDYFGGMAMLKKKEKKIELMERREKIRGY